MKNIKLFVLLIALTGSSVALLELNKDQLSKIFVDTNNVNNNVAAVLGATDNKNSINVEPASSEINIEVVDLSITKDTTLILKVRNTGDITINFSPGLQLYLVDNNGIEHAAKSLDDKNPLSGGPIASGDEYTGGINYDKGEYKFLRVYEDPQHLKSFEVKL